MRKWSDNTPREQILIVLAVGLVSVFVLWQFVINPVLSYHAYAKTLHATAVRDFDIVRTGLAKITANRSSTNRSSINSSGENIGPFTRSVLVDAARARGVGLSRVQPDGDASLTVWVDAVSTENLYAFLQDLLLKRGAVITRANISAKDDAKVSAQITIVLGN